MGGKTGTAQVVKLKMAAGNRRLKSSEMEYAQRDHAWIATWGIKDGKSYVVIVMVEHGGGGSSVAGPVARKVYDFLFGPDSGVARLRPPRSPARGGRTNNGRGMDKRLFSYLNWGLLALHAPAVSGGRGQPLFRQRHAGGNRASPSPASTSAS